MENLFKYIDTASQFTGRQEPTPDRTEQVSTGLEWAKRMTEQPAPAPAPAPMIPIVPVAN